MTTRPPPSIHARSQEVATSGAAASTYSLLASILSNPVAPEDVRAAATNALRVSECPEGYPAAPGQSALEAYRVDMALVNVGALLAERVTGRISTEVDPALDSDPAALVARGKALVALYKRSGVAADRLLVRLPATWAGCQAMRELEREGIATHALFVYSFAQAAAAAQAGASAVQVSLGRVRSWYNLRPNVIRDPHGPREDSGYKSPTDPGLALVKEVFYFLKRYHPKTKLIVSGIASRADALAVAGADYVLLPAAVRQELASTPTLSGYNDGLHEADGAASAALDAAAARGVDFREEQLAELDEATFNDLLARGVCGKELLAEGLGRHEQFAAQLSPLIAEMVINRHG